MLRDLGEASPWREVVDEYTGSADQFRERHYNEFVTFLPYVQRFLYAKVVPRWVPMRATPIRRCGCSGAATSGKPD